MVRGDSVSLASRWEGNAEGNQLSRECLPFEEVLESPPTDGSGVVRLDFELALDPREPRGALHGRDRRG